MSKQILTHELAQLVSTLLIDPSILGQLDCQDAHERFVEDIANAVAQRCGGEISGVAMSDPDLEYPSELMVSVRPDDSLPSLNDNVWSLFDEQGWDGYNADEYGIEAGEKPDASKLEKMREKATEAYLTAIVASHGKLPVSFEAVDWMIAEGEGVEDEADAQTYTVDATLGNQTYIDVVNERGDVAMGVIIEIDRGVPTLHLSKDGQEQLVHIHAAHDGIVLARDSEQVLATTAPFDRHAYFDKSAFLFKHI